MTVPSPVHGEPRRAAPAGLLPTGLLGDSIAGLLEIPGVDLVEAWGGKMDAEQVDLRGQPAGDLGAQVALAIDSETLAVRRDAERLHAHHPGDRSEPVGQPVGA